MSLEDGVIPLSITFHADKKSKKNMGFGNNKKITGSTGSNKHYT